MCRNFWLSQKEKRLLEKFEPLIKKLIKARLTGSMVDSEESEQIENLETAYQIQEKVLEGLGNGSVFWKVGSTSEEAQKKLGTDEPGSCRVPEKYCFQNGDQIPIFDTHDVWVEGEFGLRLGSELPTRDQAYSRSEVISAIDGAAAALELVGSRFRSGIANSGRYNVTADCGANIALCIGEIATLSKTSALKDNPAELYVNEKKVASGSGKKALGDPINVMVWLANQQRRRGGLRAGSVVSTGTCTGLFRVKPGDNIRLSCGIIGNVSASLEKMAITLNS